MANRFWVGGTNTWNATLTGKWSTTSGGSPGAAVPTAADDVFFNAASGAVTVTVGAASVCKSITFTGFTGTFTGSSSLTIGTTTAGGMTLVSGMTWSYTGTLSFISTSTHTLITAGKTLSNLTINGSGLVVTLGDALTVSGTLTVTLGTFSTSGSNYALTVANLSSSGSGVRTISFNASTVTINGSSALLTFATQTNLTFNAGTSTVNLTGSGTISGNTRTFYNLIFTGAITTAGAFAVSNLLTLVGSNQTTVGSAFTYANLDITGYTGDFSIQSTFSLWSYGQTWTGSIQIAANGSTITLQDNLTQTGFVIFYHLAGTLNTNGKTVSCGIYIISNALGGTRVLTLGASTFTCLAFDPVSLASFTLNANTSTFIIGQIASIGGLADWSGLTFNNLKLSGGIGNGAAGTTALTITASLFTLFGTVSFTCNTTFTGPLNFQSGLNLSGDTSTPTQITLTVNGTLTPGNSTISYINGQGSGSWNFGASSFAIIDGGNNSNIIFPPPPTPTDMYWYQNSGDITDPKWFTATNGGGTNRSIIAGDVLHFDANSFSMAGQIVTVSTIFIDNEVTFSGVTNSPTLQSGSGILFDLSATLAASLTIDAPTLYLSAGSHSAGGTAVTFAQNGATILATQMLMQDIGGGAGSVTLASDLVIDSEAQLGITLIDFTSAGYDISTGAFNANASAGKTIDLDGSTITAAMTDESVAGINLFDCYNDSTGVFSTVGTNVNITSTSSNTAHVYFDPWANSIEFLGGTLTITGGGSGDIILGGAFQALNIGHPKNIVLDDSFTTIYFKSLSATGTSGNLINFTTLNNTAFNFTYVGMNGDSIICDYIALENNVAVGVALDLTTPLVGFLAYAGANSDDNGGNTNWLFISPATTYTKTYSMDAMLQKQRSATASFDAALQKNFTKTASFDAALYKADILKTTTINANLLKTDILKTTTINAALEKNGIDVVTTITAAIQAVLNVTTAIDAYLILEGVTYTRTYTMDAALNKVIALAASIDAVLQKLDVKTLTSIDAALLKQGVTKTTTINAYLQKNILKTTSIDAYLQKNFTVSTTIDAALSRTRTVTTLIDALLQKAMIKTTSIDAVLLKNTMLATTLDVALQKGFVVGTDIDAYLLAQLNISTDIDAVLQKRVGLSTNIDARLVPIYIPSDDQTVTAGRRPSDITPSRNNTINAPSRTWSD